MTSHETSRTVSPSPSPTAIEFHEDHEEELHAIAKVSNTRKFILLLAFSIAQFLDILNVSALFAALPNISQHLNLSGSESVWLISAYQLTFASFLLMSGSLSDIYNPKSMFNLGFSTLGLLSLGAGFVHNKIGLIVLRAFTGIAGAITIPSALNLIVHLFPDPAAQARALGVFGGTAALGNVLGVVIGALLVQFTTWSWIFWLNSCLAIPISILTAFLIPNPATEESKNESHVSKIKRVDIIGIAILTAGFILFIYALTSGSTDGWSSAKVIAPLIISLFLIAAFFIYEARIPEAKAALPPRVWFYPNFAVLVGIALMPFLWWSTSFFLLNSLWQDVYGWSPVLAGVRFLPLGVLAFLVMTLVAALNLATRYSIKRILLFASVLVIPATILLPFAGGKDRYWPIVFPAFILGTIGTTLLFNVANIAMFKYTPPTMAGTVGAIFNSSLQIGSAIGLAIITSIETNVEDRTGGPTHFQGRAAGYWFLLGTVCVEVLVILLFLKSDAAPPVEVKEPKAVDGPLEKVESSESLTPSEKIRRKNVPSV